MSNKPSYLVFSEGPNDSVIKQIWSPRNNFPSNLPESMVEILVVKDIDNVLAICKINRGEDFLREMIRKSNHEPER